MSDSSKEKANKIVNALTALYSRVRKSEKEWVVNSACGRNTSYFVQATQHKQGVIDGECGTRKDKDSVFLCQECHQYLKEHDKGKL